MSPAAKRIAPGIKQWFPWSGGEVVRGVLHDPLGFYLKGRARFGDVFRYQIGHLVFHLVSHPDGVKHVLADNAKNYPRSWMQDYLKLLLGDGLVTSEGEFWRRQRRLAQPAFSRPRLAGFVEIMTECTEALLRRWEPLVAKQVPLDIAKEMSRLALAIASRTLFSVDVSGEADEVGPALAEAIDYIDYRMNKPLALPLWLPTRRNARFKRSRTMLNRVVGSIIEDRRRNPRECHDLLQFLIAARDEETGQSMSDQQLRDEVMTFLMAGHETTANALAWTWYLLSLHPDVRGRLQAEVETVLGGRAPSVKDLLELSFTRMVIDESMRLYPPVWGILRSAAEDDEIGGFHIPRKSIVALVQYVTHRHPDFWVNPEGFDPERFTSAAIAQRPKYAYFPFIGGPHQCIGNEFAIMEAQIAIAMIAQKYELNLVSEHRVQLDPTITLRPRQGILMTVHERGGNR